MTDWREQEIPIFPLNNVLFPGGLLELRIFEPRYLDMVSECMKRDMEFGVVLIREGEEVGAAAAIYHTGTLARIIDWRAQEDGLLGISCMGGRRFAIQSLRVTPAQLTLAHVLPLEAAPLRKIPAEYQQLAELLQVLWRQEGERLATLPTAFDNAAWVGDRLLELLPLPLDEKQRLLGLNDPLATLRYLAPLIAARGSA